MSEGNFFSAFPNGKYFHLISLLILLYCSSPKRKECYSKHPRLLLLYAGSEFHCDSQFSLFSSLSLAFAAVRAERIHKIYFMFYDTEKNETSNSHSCCDRRSSKNTACVEVKKGKTLWNIRFSLLFPYRRFLRD